MKLSLSGLQPIEHAIEMCLAILVVMLSLFSWYGFPYQKICSILLSMLVIMCLSSYWLFQAAADMTPSLWS